ncbi:MAG: ABC transporter transmembrane domain-containing protein, partial [Planctomycetota bacterium]
MKSLLRMLRLLRNYPGRLAHFVLAALVYAVFHMSFAAVAKVVTGILERSPAAWLPDVPLGRLLLWTILAAVGLLVGKCVFYYLRRYLQSWLSRRIVIDTQNDVAAHLLTLDLGYFQRVRQGELVSRMTNDMRMLAQTATLFCQLVSQPLVLVVGVGYVVWLNWRLAFLALVAAPLAVAVLSSLSRKMRRASKRSFEKQADATAVFLQFVGGIKEVKAFGREAFERDRFGEEMRAVFNVGMKGARARARVRPLVEFFSGIGLMAVFYAGGLWVLDGQIALDELMGFVAALGWLTDELSEHH